jgi:hypothetical protein
MSSLSWQADSSSATHEISWHEWSPDLNSLFVRTRHSSLSLTRWMQSTSYNLISLRRFCYFPSVYSRLVILCYPIPCGFPTIRLFAYLVTSIRATYPTPFILLYLISLIFFWWRAKLMTLIIQLSTVSD